MPGSTPLSARTEAPTEVDVQLETVLTSFDTNYVWNYGCVKEGPPAPSVRDLKSGEWALVRGVVGQGGISQGASGEAEEKVIPAGITSVTATSDASLGPLFVTVIV